MASWVSRGGCGPPCALVVLPNHLRVRDTEIARIADGSRPPPSNVDCIRSRTELVDFLGCPATEHQYGRHPVPGEQRRAISTRSALVNRPRMTLLMAPSSNWRNRASPCGQIRLDRTREIVEQVRRQSHHLLVSAGEGGTIGRSASGRGLLAEGERLARERQAQYGGRQPAMPGERPKHATAGDKRRANEAHWEPFAGFRTDK